MGLLDGVLGSVASALGGGSAQAGANPLGNILAGLAGGNQTQSKNVLGAVLGMVQEQGGLEGVIGLLRSKGLGGQVESWIGTGANKSLQASEITNALGSANLGKLAAQLGVSDGQAGSTLAQVLPELINQFTPDGALPANSGDVVKQALAALTGGAR